MSVLDKIFGTHSEREVKLVEKTVDEIEALRPEMMSLSDEELRGKTDYFKKRLADGETLDDILVEAFAVVREASRRVTGMEHFRVQLIGGIILHQGRIAEMKTGEGKTLAATAPAYLNALEGKGVHIVTVNDYLANRDATEMGRIHEFLGMSCKAVLSDMDKDERREAYNSDITYITNNEDGFDYLRDNMVVYEKDQVQRGLHYAIIDEVDSVLIDEARTPLIISGQSGKSTKLYEACDVLARQLKRGDDLPEFSKMDAIMGIVQEETGDFIVNEKDKVVNLTAAGVKKTEEFFRIDNLADAENLEIQHNVILALRAHNLMHRDQDYVIQDDQVLIVDTFTGRIMPGRRYSDGLHQAIEAKEHVKVKRESMTLATITFQNFFNKYDKKAGMTGTGLTEEQEFRDIYGMDVIEIPTNMPMIRVDHDDAVYKTKNGKYISVIEDVKASHAKGQPVLVGTVTIDVSEEISRRLRREGIPHQVLNAKYHEKEAQIIADAGKHGAVTIATNMAGRGTDIKLDEEAKAAGGLKIIGTERHEARRIDNQLRGRSGRQGDVGESKFYVSLEDDLMRLFGSERLMTIFNSLGVEETDEIQHKMLSNALENAQKKIESNNFGIRKNLLEYDQVMNDQRELIYGQRSRVLAGEDMKEQILGMIKIELESAIDTCCSDEIPVDKWDLAEMNSVIRDIIPFPPFDASTLDGVGDVSDFKDKLLGQAYDMYAAKEAEFPEAEQFREIERIVLLRVIDKKWMEEIDDMDQLRQSVGLQAYGQRNPVDEYKMASYDMVDAMNEAIRHDTVQMLYRVRIEKKLEREEVAKETGTNKEEGSARGPMRRKEAKIRPNAPCPCGSGKKYKYCHGRSV